MTDMPTVRVDERVKDRVNEEAKKRGVTVNKLIKELLHLSDSISFFVDNKKEVNEDFIEAEKPCLGSIAGQCATLVRWRPRVRIPPRAFWFWF